MTSFADWLVAISELWRVALVLFLSALEAW